MPKKREWGKGELEKLSKLYDDNKATIEEMMLQLPGRTENAIRLKASRLGLARPVIDGFIGISDLRWTTHEHDDRLNIHEDALDLQEAIAEVMSSETLAATGYRGRKPEVTINRGE